MADKFWVNGSGDWSDDTNHWSLTSGGLPLLGLLPTSSDDVFINDQSGLSGGTLSHDGGGVCNNFVSNTGFAYTFDFPYGDYLSIYGSLTLESGITASGSFGFTFLSTNVGNTITTAGVVLGPTYFSGVGGEWTLQDNLESDNGIILIYGTFDANDHDVKAPTIYLNND
jgi:hypothetical protein